MVLRVVLRFVLGMPGFFVVSLALSLTIGAGAWSFYLWAWAEKDRTEFALMHGYLGLCVVTDRGAFFLRLTQLELQLLQSGYSKWFYSIKIIGY
jgi:hypothetical protein